MSQPGFLGSKQELKDALLLQPCYYLSGTDGLQGHLQRCSEVFSIAPTNTQGIERWQVHTCP